MSIYQGQKCINIWFLCSPSKQTFEEESQKLYDENIQVFTCKSNLSSISPLKGFFDLMKGNSNPFNLSN